MSTQHQYTLDKSSKKHLCPDCNKKTFVFYIDTETGDYLPEQFGRCDRESKCNYHLKPLIRKEQDLTSWKPQRQKAIPQPQSAPVFFDFETFIQTLQPERYEKNTFIQNLLNMEQFPFEVSDIEKVISLYRLGTVSNGYRAGAVTLPFIDTKGNTRAIQVKEFDEDNHTTSTDFLHSIIEKHCTQNNKPLPAWLEAYTKQDKRITCLFGEHLLSKYPTNPIALVEAPKTSIYGSLYFGLPETPESLIWLAVYNKSSFTIERVKVLRNRNVIVIPDLSKDGNTFKEWETKAKDFEKRLPGTQIKVSDLLERLATQSDKDKGNDLADILIRGNWRDYRKQPPPPEPQKVTGVTKVTHQQNFLFSHDELKPIWYKPFKDEQPIIKQPFKKNSLVIELEKYFENTTLPTEPIKLNTCLTIEDINSFLQSHFKALNRNINKSIAKTYLNRLHSLKQHLEAS